MVNHTRRSLKEKLSNYLLVAVLQAYKNDQALNKKGISTRENCAAVMYYFELYNYLNIKK